MEKRTPHHEFVIPILSVLQQCNGSAHTQKIYAHVEYKLMLTSYDRQIIDGKVKEPYWKNQTRVAALRMREKGLLEPSRQHGIWSISNTGLNYLANSKYNVDIYPDTLSNENLIEGSVSKITVNKYERNPIARKQCIDYFGCRCQICGLALSELYGDLANGVIHVHHLTPISQIGHEYNLDPIRDLRPVCPNCHTILHLKSPPLTIEEARTLWSRHNNSNAN